MKKQQRKRRNDDKNEIENAITQVRDYKGKKIKPDSSDIDTDGGTSLATTQDLLEFSDETSVGLASCPSSNPQLKQDPKQEEKGKRKRKRKEKKEDSEMSQGESKSIPEKSPRRKSSKKRRPSSKRRRSSQKGEDQTQVNKKIESAKPSESAGSGNMNKNVVDPNNTQKCEPTDTKEPCNDKVAPKEGNVDEEQHEEESSSSSG